MRDTSLEIFKAQLMHDGSEKRLLDEIHATSLTIKLPFIAVGGIEFEMAFELSNFKKYYRLYLKLTIKAYKRRLKLINAKEISLSEFIEIESNSDDFQMAFFALKNFINKEPPPF